MGSQLDKPVVEKHGRAGKTDIFGRPISFALSSMQGWRKAMEDYHTLETTIEEFPNVAFFAVFDGHGGQSAAQYAARNLVKCIFRPLKYGMPKPTIDELPDFLSNRMTNSFLAVDHAFQGQGSRFGYDFSGSTAVTLTITRDSYVIANLGDSRLMVSDSRGGVVFSTIDHKPYMMQERRRIEQAGGTVRMQRVNGDLAVSRAFGDYRFKEPPYYDDDKKQVIAIPTVDVIKREKDHHFALLACDGIWDVMTCGEVASFVHQRLLEGMTTRETCDCLIDWCLGLDSRDNMSVILVVFTDVEISPCSSTVAQQQDTSSEVQHAEWRGVRDVHETKAIENFEERLSHEIGNLNTHSFTNPNATGALLAPRTKLSIAQAKSRALASRRATLVHDPKLLKEAVSASGDDSTAARFKLPKKPSQFSSRNPMKDSKKTGFKLNPSMRDGSQFSSRNPLKIDHEDHSTTNSRFRYTSESKLDSQAHKADAKIENGTTQRAA